MLGKLHPIGGELVDVRSLDLLLAVASQLPVAEVVGEEEYDVGGGCFNFFQNGSVDTRSTEQQHQKCGIQF